MTTYRIDALEVAEDIALLEWSELVQLRSR